jgi:hypothetical protein
MKESRADPEEEEGWGPLNERKGTAAADQPAEGIARLLCLARQKGNPSQKVATVRRMIQWGM